MIRGRSKTPSEASCVVEMKTANMQFYLSKKMLFRPWPLQPAAISLRNNNACVMDKQTCSSPPLRSSSSFGWPGSGPGLPLCRHHRASSDALQENGPSRRRLWSFNAVLTNRSCSSSCSDTAWSGSRNTNIPFFSHLITAALIPALLWC